MLSFLKVKKIGATRLLTWFLGERYGGDTDENEKNNKFVDIHFCM